jgi:hypothetical protein
MKKLMVVAMVAVLAVVVLALEAGAHTVSWTYFNDPGSVDAYLGTWTRLLEPNLSDPDLDFEGIQAPGTNRSDHVGAAPRPWNSDNNPAYAHTYARVAGTDGWAGEYDLSGPGTGQWTFQSRQLDAWKADLNAIPYGEMRRYMCIVDYDYVRNRDPFYFELFLWDSGGTFYYSNKTYQWANTGGWLEDRLVFIVDVSRTLGDPDLFNSAFWQVVMSKGLTTDESTLRIDNIEIFVLNHFPEPGSAMLLALAAVAGIRRRSRPED